MSTRIDENGAKTKKLWLKQCTRDLFVRVLNFLWLASKKPGAKNLIEPYTQGLTSKNKVQGWWVLFLGKIGAKIEKKGLFCKYF